MRHGGVWLVTGFLLALTLYLLLANDPREKSFPRDANAPTRRGNTPESERGSPGTLRDAPFQTGDRPPHRSPAKANRAVIAKTDLLPRKRPWDRAFLSSLAQAREGSQLTFELVAGEMASGKIGYLVTTNRQVLYVSGTCTNPEPGRFFFQKQTRPGVAGEFVGIVEFPASEQAYRIEPSGPGGAPELVQRSLGEVLCLRLPVPAGQGTNQTAEIPPLNPGAFPDLPVPGYQNGINILESLRGATAVVYLDFTGGYTPTWGGMTYAPPAMSKDQIREVWRRVAEDFMPFNINVTTDLRAFQDAPQVSRQRVIITPTTMVSHESEGGIAAIGSFNYSPEMPCWVFQTVEPKACAEACSHEAGHTLSLAKHEGQDKNHVEYYLGQGQGETGWAPIMGEGYYQIVSQWCHGEYLDANNTEDELATIVSQNNNVAYRTDDTGDTLATSRYLELYPDYTASAEGMIERTADTDAFRFSTFGGPVWLRADPVSFGPNLALAVSLYDANDSLVASNCPQDTLWAGLSNNLPAGTYTFRVTGAGRNDPLTNGFSSYASLGYYSITGLVANARLPDRFAILEHATNGTVVGTIAARNGGADPPAFTIATGNTSNTFALDSSGVLRVAENRLLDYTSLASQTQFPVQFELFVNIADLLDPSLSEINRRVIVAILPVVGAPVITQQPQSLIVAAGLNAFFSVAAIGEYPIYDPLQYQWFFNGEVIADAATPALSINDAQLQAAGNYTVVVTNSFGAVTSLVATLTVTPLAPLFTQQPADADVLSGSGVGFVALSVGTEPIAYQWQHNGVDLPGQTNRSLVRIAELSNAGSYRVLASNSAGVTASADAHLSVRILLAWGWNGFGQLNVPSGLTNVVQISAGSEHTLALLREGKVVAWGTGAQTNVPPALAGVVNLSAGGSQSLALRRDGAVVAWGQDTAGQTDVPQALSNAVAIAAGGSHSLALRADGTVAAWGSNTNGQCNVPAGLSGVVAIAAGANHSLALEADGTVVAWGDNVSGQTSVPSDLTDAVAIAAGAQHSLALKADGTVTVWGNDFYGQRSLKPRSGQKVAISAGAFHNLVLQADGSVIGWGAGEWASSTSPQWGQALVPGGVSRIAAVAAGGEHSVVLAGEGAPFITYSPVSRIAAAHSQVIFRAEASGAWPLSFQWQLAGTNLVGATNQVLVLDDATNAGDYQVLVSNALGVATSGVARLALVNRPPSVRVQPAGQTAYLSSALNLQVGVEGSTPFSYQWRFNGENLPDATNATLTLDRLQMSQSGAYSIVVSNAYGVVSSAKAVVQVAQVAAWGDDSAGQTDVPSGLVGVVQVAGGDYHSLALRANGTVVAWGGGLLQSNLNFGQTIVPADLTNAVAIAAGGYHSLALRADGTVTAWGAGSSNSSGSGLYQFGQASVPAGLTEVVAIAAGKYYSVALREDGHVVVWGGGPYDLTNVPTEARDIVAVAAGPDFIMVIGADGPIIHWGAQIPLPTGGNFVAIAPGVALWDNGTVSTTRETQQGPHFPFYLPSVLEVAGSANQIMARISDGTLLFLGGNVGTFTTNALSHAIAIACGQSHSLVALGDGSLQITAQPSSRKVTLGGKTLLRVVAAGEPPLRFQWRLNGADLAGANNFWLRLTNLQFSDAGLYTVVVSNPAHSLTSQVATLSVRLPSLPLGLTLDAQGLSWVSQGISPWFGQTNISHDGVAAAQSGPIGDSQQSILRTTVSGPGTLDFWWKVSSEQWFDFLNFAINGQIQAAISGEVDWQIEHFEIPPGNNLLSWTYVKDPSSSAGLDAGWLDQVVYRTNPPVITQQPISQVVPMRTNILLIVAAYGAPPLWYQWLKSGTNLPGATSALLAISNSTRHGSGTYAVAVSNPGGTTVSSNAQVLVRVPQGLQAVAWLPQGGFTLLSHDADGAPLQPADQAGFEVQISTNLIEWTPLPSQLTLTNGVLLLMDPEATNSGHRFYRIIESF